MNRILAIALVAMTGTAAAADEYYFGLNYNVAVTGNELSNDILGGHAGARFGQGSLSFGAEVEYGFGMGSDAVHDSMRFRGVVYNDLGDFGLFGTLGMVNYDVYASGSDFGATYGLGAEYDVTNSTSVRLEVLRDQVELFDTSGVTSLRVGASFSF